MHAVHCITDIQVPANQSHFQATGKNNVTLVENTVEEIWVTFINY